MAVDVHVLYQDQVAQPLLKSSLNQELSSCGEFVAVGSKDELQETAAKVRSVHPLTGPGKKELLYEVPDMVIIVCRGSSPASIEMKRVIGIHPSS